MNSQFYFARAGWLLSSSISCCVIFTLMYNMLLLTRVADALQYSGKSAAQGPNLAPVWRRVNTIAAF